MTRPVILAAMVARRRGVTYPEALSRASRPPEPVGLWTVVIVDDRLLLPKSEGRSRNATQDYQKAKKDSEPLADSAAFALALVNAQRGEVMFGRTEGRGH